MKHVAEVIEFCKVTEAERDTSFVWRCVCVRAVGEPAVECEVTHSRSQDGANPLPQMLIATLAN